MKKYIFTITILLSSVTMIAHAQKIAVGIQGGASFSNYTMATDEESESGKYKPGFTIGVMFDKSMGKKFYFQPAINYVMKGAKDNTLEDAKLTMHYLEVPLNFVYRAKKETGFFVGGGPSIGMGITGQFEYQGQKDDFDFGGEYNADRFEVEANVLTGYKFNKFQVAANFNFGLTSLTDEPSVRFKNNYFGLRLGYYFK